MILYCFDLKPGKPQDYNRLKRRFYYHLNRSVLAGAQWRTKSVLSVPAGLEHRADSFFRRWRGSIEVYKIRATSVREIA